jgi:hypothetical protein
MRVLALVVICVALVGCFSYKPDQRVVGRFGAPAGEVVDIRSDGRIIFIVGGKEELVGLVTIDQEEPLSIRVIAPDTSPLVGTKIVFSADGTQISVEWSAWRGAGPKGERPTEFRKVEEDVEPVD